MAVMTMTAMAQRQNMDRLDRGLVAIKVSSGVYCSWRIQADEYYDVTYNLYRNGTKVNSTPLTTSNYTDASGSATSKYTVKAVVRGVEQAASKEASVMSTYYKEIVPKHDASLTSTYVPNDACCADVDGDGELEILIKYDNSEEINNLFPKAGNNNEYTLLECLKQDGTVLWWVNCGPNMGDFQNNEQNIVGYDWDGNGKAEVVMRLSEGATIHMADGTTYTVGADGKNGTSWTNYRYPKTPGGVEWFTYYGNEFLAYVDGETGKPWTNQLMEFPCRRYESGETDLNKAWGDGYGHRSSKYFFGAPYLDGKKPSIFVGRGIYTRHKFVALDVNPSTHELTERWRWMNNTPGPWYGQGYHNYSIADVDWDGRDEIIWGSMVIDDNGKGLSTTGLGHGDAHHVSDFDPYTHGQEGFFCNEDEPQNNLRDLTTSKIYYRTTGTDDDGRAIMGNFYNDFPGAAGATSHDSSSPISAVTKNHISGFSTNGMHQNFRIYWDGDLLEETFNGTGTRNTQGRIDKPGTGARISTLEGSLTNNDSKATPCFQGDIYGDWREEVIMRTADNKIRIYSTTIPTEHRNYSLWYDHQYRNAMVWQMCGYNQPPHVSYFLGELEGITQAPPALTTQGREVVANGASISSSYNGKHVMLDATSDATISVANGAAPYIFTDNAPSWVQGTAPSECTTKDTEIKYNYYTHTVTGGAFSGDMRLVKQGDGTLVLPNVTQTYSGETSIWAGTLCFDGTMQNSKVWLNRFAELNSDGGNFQKGIKADYASVIRPGGKDKVGTITVSDLELGFGARIVFDVKNGNVDKVVASKLSIEKKEWAHGPQYAAPVFEFTSVPAAGEYTLVETSNLTGNIENVVIEGLTGQKYSVAYADGKVKISVETQRAPQEEAIWTGEQSSDWDLIKSQNFNTPDKKFVGGDGVVFNDNATVTNVNVAESVTPSSVVFLNNTKTYTLSGDGEIAGDIPVYISGTGTVNIKNVNKFTGGTYINAGTLVPATLANKDGVEYGSLGPVDNSIMISNQATLKIDKATTFSHGIVLGENGGTINTTTGTVIHNGAITKQSGASNVNLYKTGSGTLQLGGESSPNVDAIYINAGTVYDFADKHFNNKTVVLNGGTLQYNNSIYGDASDNVKIEVPAGKTGTLIPDGRCNYTGSLTGAGTLKVTATWVRCPFQGNWSAFEGTIQVTQGSKNQYDPTFDFNNTYGIGKATLQTNAGSNVHFNGKNFAIGALTGSGALYNSGNWGSSTNTLTIGGKNTDFSFTGTIDGSSVVKNGTGVWTIASETVLAAAKSLTIEDGAVKLNKQAATSSMTSPTITYVKKTGELRGLGYVYGLTLNTGAGLRPGSQTPANQDKNTGWIEIQKNLIADAGSNIYVNATKVEETSVNSKTGATIQNWSYLKVGGNVTLNGTIHVSYGSGWTPAVGNKVRVVAAQGTISGTPSFELQTLPEGMAWDTSSLLTDGTISVIASTGIHDVKIDDDAMVVAEVYGISGAKVATFKCNRKSVPNVLKLQNISSGVYMLRMSNGKGVETQKINVK